MCRGIQHPSNEEAFDEEPYDKEDWDGEEKGEIRVNAQEDIEPISGEHAQHHKGAMGKINDLHDPEDHGQANGHQAVHPSHKNSIDYGLKKKRKTRNAHNLPVALGRETFIQIPTIKQPKNTQTLARRTYDSPITYFPSLVGPSYSLSYISDP